VDLDQMNITSDTVSRDEDDQSLLQSDLNSQEVPPPFKANGDQNSFSIMVFLDKYRNVMTFVTILIAVFGLIATSIWWAATINNKVKTVEENICENKEVINKVAERSIANESIVSKLQDSLSRLIDRFDNDEPKRQADISSSDVKQ